MTFETNTNTKMVTYKKSTVAIFITIMVIIIIFLILLVLYYVMQEQRAKDNPDCTKCGTCVPSRGFQYNTLQSLYGMSFTNGNENESTQLVVPAEQSGDSFAFTYNIMSNESEGYSKEYSIPMSNMDLTNSNKGIIKGTTTRTDDTGASNIISIMFRDSPKRPNVENSKNLLSVYFEDKMVETPETPETQSNLNIREVYKYEY